MPLTEKICFGDLELSLILVLNRPMMTSKLFELPSFKLLQALTSCSLEMEKPC